MTDTVASLSAELTALATRLSNLVQSSGVQIPQPVTGLAKYFSVQSGWNTKIAASPTLMTGSANLIKRLAALNSFSLNQGQWAVNVAIAPKGFAGPRVTARNPDGWTMNNVPMLPEAVGTTDSDAHLVIIDEDRNVVWNFQGDTKNTGAGYTAGAMGAFRLGGPGWYDPAKGGPWTGRSSNACLLGGLITPDELRSGAIYHALALGVDGSLLGASPVLPALTTDAGGVAGGLPNGSRLQLNSSFDASGLGKEARIIAKALQDYGAFVVERTSGVALYFQSTLNGKATYAGMNFAGLTPALLAQCRIVAPAASYEYDYPARFAPAQPYKV